jgi:hypothetical protein
MQSSSNMTHAAVLNIMQIMPCVWARFDRIWYGHPGKLVGTKTSQPLLVPLDHVFEVRKLLKLQLSRKLYIL